MDLRYKKAKKLAEDFTEEQNADMKKYMERSDEIKELIEKNPNFEKAMMKIISGGLGTLKWYLSHGSRIKAIAAMSITTLVMLEDKDIIKIIVK